MMWQQQGSEDDGRYDWIWSLDLKAIMSMEVRQRLGANVDEDNN